MAPSRRSANWISCAGAAAWVTPLWQGRQAYFGRMVTNTRSSWQDVQPLRAIFANFLHFTAAARAEPGLGLDDLFHPGKVCREIAEVALDCGLLGARRWQRRVGDLLDFRDGRLEILETELALIGAQSFGLLAEERPLEFLDQIIVALVQLDKGEDLILLRLKHCSIVRQQRAYTNEHRSALAHHVHRTAGLGTKVLINARQYYSALSPVSNSIGSGSLANLKSFLRSDDEYSGGFNKIDHPPNISTHLQETSFFWFYVLTRRTCISHNSCQEIE